MLLYSALVAEVISDNSVIHPSAEQEGGMAIVTKCVCCGLRDCISQETEQQLCVVCVGPNHDPNKVVGMGLHYRRGKSCQVCASCLQVPREDEYYFIGKEGKLTCADCEFPCHPNCGGCNTCMEE